MDTKAIHYYLTRGTGYTVWTKLNIHNQNMQIINIAINVY